MNCCARYCAAEAQFGEEVAERDLRRYRRRGADSSTRMVLEELRRWPLRDKELLDVGGGIGVVCAELAESGLAGATLVEASPAYLEVARTHLAAHYASHPARFVLGDFASLADTLPDAEAVTLDRVVCCYPDVEALLQAAASRSRHLLAFTYPRDRWYVRAVIAMENLLRRLKGCAFRAFVHSPERMAATLKAAGLTLAARRASLIWVMELHHRS
jgi:magnesium-protoporphyrin O-methyltransferase